MSSGLVGSVEPRLWTPPLRPLTPETSFGFEVIEFARDVLGRALFPWQEWLLIHACELGLDGLPRFGKVLVTIARQNGKTEVLVVLSLYWIFVDLIRGRDWPRVNLVLGTSTNLDTAKESWEKAVTLAESTPELAEEIPRGGVRRANGEQQLSTAWGARYKIAASNRKGGRGLTVGRLILDELREHHDWTAYDAAVPATTTVSEAQVWMLSNAGDDRSVVLNEIREQALAETDPRLAIFEWSAPTDDPTDIANLLAANPSVGHNISLESLLTDAARAKAAGGEQLTGFITEHLCRRVSLLNPAIDERAWGECVEVGTMDALRERVALCLDVSLDGMHASLYAAALQDDGRVRVEPVQAWEGPDCTQHLRLELPGLVARVKPRVVGWFPNGPAASIAADMAERDGWPPEGLEVEALRSDAQAVCMGFAEQVLNCRIAHSNDPLLNAHVLAAEKRAQGDGWRFARRGAGHVDAVYAAAGATHLARTLPPEEPAVSVFFA